MGRATWLLIAAGVVVAVVVTAVLVGLIWPREHVASSRILVHQPPAAVRAVIRNFGNLPAWWTEIRTSERVPQAGPERWRQTMSGFEMVIEVVEDSMPMRLVTRIVSPPGAAFGGTWTYEITPVAGGSQVTITETGWISNPLFRAIGAATGLHRTLDGYLTALGRKLGEPVRPEQVSVMRQARVGGRGR
ncbi:MAG: SRPBCC family protein [Gemmatimonadota bacterium]